MSVKPDPTTPGTWIIDCRPGGYQGKRLRKRVEGTRELAEQVHQLLMRKPPADYKRPANQTLSQIYREWIAYYPNAAAKSTVEDAKSCWSHLEPVFGRHLVKTLSERLIENYKSDKSKSLKPRTINKHLTYLSSMLKWAARSGLCDKLHFDIPFYPAKMTRAAKPRPISAEQITAIYEAIEPEYKLIFLLMSDAGLRRNEALQLKRDHVEYDSGLIFVTGKGSKERIVPISTNRLRVELIKVVYKSGYLSTNPRTGRPYLSIRKALLRAAEKAGIDKHIYHHLLRHSFGTNATISGVDVKALQSIMGHSSADTTQIYQHLSAEYLRDQIKKMKEK